jgi:hypothetical protein
VCPGHETLDLGVHHQPGFAQVVHEGLPYPDAAFRAALAFDLGQRPPESIASLRQTGVADDDVGALAAHVLDNVAARGPEVREAGHVGLQCERVDAARLYRVDEIEPVPVTAVEVDANCFRPVGGGRKRKRLADTPILTGARDQDPFAGKGGVIRFTKFEVANVRRERHRGRLRYRYFLRSPRVPQNPRYLWRS